MFNKKNYFIYKKNFFFYFNVFGRYVPKHLDEDELHVLNQCLFYLFIYLADLFQNIWVKTNYMYSTKKKNLLGVCEKKKKKKYFV